MVDFLQGPGQNTNYYLITTGINSDPCNGSMAYENYDQIKKVIQQRAEITFENDIVRKFTGIITDDFLEAYDDEPRTVYQALIGTARYSDPWTCDDLQEAIGQFPRNSKTIPKNGEYSIDFVDSRENGMKIHQSVMSPAPVWVENDDFYYSGVLPYTGVGRAGDVWFVSSNNQYELYYRPAYAWFNVNDYRVTQTPVGKIFITEVEPFVQANSWWLDPTGIVLRRYSTSINNWEAPAPVTVGEIEPVAPNLGDLWLKTTFGRMTLFSFNGIRFVSETISQHPVRDPLTNSAYVGEDGENNYLVECGDIALMGGILSNVGESCMVKVYDEGVLVGEYDSINFIGTSVTVDDNALDGRADVTISTNAAGDTVFSFNDTITVNGQVDVQLPAQAVTIIEYGINGIETTNFTFNGGTKIITFDPIASTYQLEIGDKVHVIFKDV